MHPGIESVTVNMTTRHDPASVYNCMQKKVIISENDKSLKNGEVGEHLDTSQQYFWWCCVQQQMYQYQLLAATFASSRCEPPRMPQPLLYPFPPIFNGLMKCSRDLGVLEQAGFPCLDTFPDVYRNTRQEPWWNNVREQNHRSQKTNSNPKKPTCRALFECFDSSPMEKVEWPTVKQKGSHIEENPRRFSEESGGLEGVSRDSLLEKYLEEEYQVAKNNAEEDCSSSTSHSSLMKGAYLLSNVMEIPTEEVEPEIPPELQGPGGHVFLRMLSRSWRQYKRALEQNE